MITKEVYQENLNENIDDLMQRLKSFMHTVSANGKTYEIEFAYSTDWQNNVDKWASVLTKSYVVYLPEDYDGLIFAAETQPDNYKDSAKRMQLDSISPEACLMDIVTLDARSNLYFDIC